MKILVYIRSLLGEQHYLIINICCRITRRRHWQPTPVLLPGKSHGRRSLVGCSPWGGRGVTEGRTRLSDFTFTFHFHALEKEMATHSSVLAWRIPGMGEPHRLLSMGSHRVGYDWSDLAAAAAAVCNCLWICENILWGINEGAGFIGNWIDRAISICILF